LRRFIVHEVWRQRLGLANATLIIVAVLTIGQVRYEQRHSSLGSASSLAPGLSAPVAVADPATAGAPTGGAGPAAAVPGAPGPAAGAAAPSASTQTQTQTAPPALTGPTKAPAPLPAARRGGRSTAPGSSSKGTATTTTTKGVTGTTPGAAKVAVPDFGLITQGVTATSVKIGADYNKSGCGGTGALEASFGSAATGDPEKAITAFKNYVNDTGGIRGRKLDVVTVDDGGLGCPEQHAAAAKTLVDDQKVFMDLAGLHEVSQLLAPRHLPFMGGDGTIAQQNQQGYGQFQLFQDADGDFANWASFGKNYINSPKDKPCLIHPSTDDFRNLDKLLQSKLAEQGYKFAKIVEYDDNASTAQQQATTSAIAMKGECNQVWLIANNGLADVFFTSAASQQAWYPTWTWTSRTAGIDTQLFGALMDQTEWQKSIGLSVRIKPKASPYEGNCAKIYDKYYPNDGQSGSAAVLVACPSVLSSAEAMRRAIDKTGVLTGNSLMVGVSAIQGDFFYDAHVPLTWNITKTGQSEFTGYDLQTVAKWDTAAGDYAFPEYPVYWKLMGANKSGGVDIRPSFTKTYTPPKG
jgi:hypothetical protein